jgi:large subunit ribosomal protein L24
MPLYLSEELSPRFSRAKKTKGWNDRREVAILEREETAKAAVAAWEAQGRDKGLKEVLSEVGLEGIRLRGRTRKEIREAALAEYDLAAEGVKAEVKDARRRGRVWQSEGGEGFWVEGEKGERLARKQHRKELSTQKAERRMERLTLAETRNTVVPPLAQS